MTKLTTEKKVARQLQALCDAACLEQGLQLVPYTRCLSLVRANEGKAIEGTGPFAARLFEAHKDALIGGRR